MIVGHHDFSRYDTPGWCQAAAGWTANFLRGTLEAEAAIDTVRSWADTIGAAGVAATAQACGQRFTAATVNPELLPNLFDLALQAQEDPLAEAVVARFAQLHSDVQWHAVIQGYLDARPPRLAAAQAVMATLDAHSATSVRVDGHHQLLQFWEEREDTAHSRAEAEQLVRLGAAMTPADRAKLLESGQPLWHAYTTLMTLAFLRHPAVMVDSAVQARYTAVGGTAPVRPTAAFGDPVSAVWEELDPVNSWRHTGWEWLKAQRLRPMPHWQASYWFPASAAQFSPVPGKVNLYVLYPGGRADGTIAAKVRRWLARYQGEGLVITMVATTRGFTWDAQSGQQPFGPWADPGVEAADFATYVQQYEQLPVTVAVRNGTPQERRPAPDGRWIPLNPGADTTWEAREFEYDEAVAVLVGRNGKYLDQQRFANDEGLTAFEALMAWAVAQPAPPRMPQASASSITSAAAGHP